MRFDRTNTTFLGRWWWTVDRTAWFALLTLIFLGAVMVAAGSPPVAERLGLDPFYFIGRHQVFLGLALVVMFVISNLPVNQVRRMAVLLFLGSVLAMALLPLIGFENKGATRWIRFAGMSVQPSEFMKPCFAIVMAWLFAEKYKTPGFPGFRVALAVYAIVVGLLIIQPDFGMVVTVTAMFGLQFFLAGMPFIWVTAMAAFSLAGVWMAYSFLPHVTKRIDAFLDPNGAENYQVRTALDAFQNGGWLGLGPGEGEVKQHIPDSHTDFIFAVAGEEFGLLFSLFIVGIFAFIVLRGYARLLRETDLFVMIATAGILAQFGIQAIINMGVAVNLLPAKGMTLPFISYGGSSLVAMAIGMGMLLALTRRRYGQYKVALG